MTTWVKARGDLEAQRDSSTSTRLVPGRAKSLGSPGVVVVFFAVLVASSFFFVFFGARGTVVVPWGPSSSARNLRGATRSRADLRTVGIGAGRGYDGGVLRGGPVAIVCRRGRAGLERRLDSSLGETGDQRARPVVENRRHDVVS
jgi:hypothetical protein